jgi:hypothetical protein
MWVLSVSMPVGLCLSRVGCACQSLFHGWISQERVSREQEHRSFDRRHFLAYAIQEPDHAEKVIMFMIQIIRFMTIILIIRIMYIIRIISFIHIILMLRIMLIIYIILYCDFRSVANWAWQITCGRTSVPPSLRRLKGWALSFVRPCTMVGLNTSRPHMLPSPGRRQRAHPLGRGGWSWKMIEHDFHQNDDLLRWSSLWKAWRPISTMNTHLQRRFCFANNAYNS